MARRRDRVHTKRKIVLPLWLPGHIYQFRMHLGMSQPRFADRLVVRHMTISDWETGRHAPRRSMRLALTRLAKQVHFEIGDLP